MSTVQSLLNRLVHGRRSVETFWSSSVIRSWHILRVTVSWLLRETGLRSLSPSKSARVSPDRSLQWCSESFDRLTDLFLGYSMYDTSLLRVAKQKHTWIRLSFITHSTDIISGYKLLKLWWEYNGLSCFIQSTKCDIKS